MHSMTTLETVYTNCSWLHFAIKHLYLDKNAFKEATTLTIIVPFVSSFT